MSRRKVISTLLIFLVLLMVAVSAGGFFLYLGSLEEQSRYASSTTNVAPRKLPPLEFSIWYWGQNVAQFSDAKYDVVSEEIEKKFNIRAREVYSRQGVSFDEMLALFIASNTLPDVVFSLSGTTKLPATGKFADIGNHLKENCPNLMKYYPESEWRNLLYKSKMYFFPRLILNYDERFKNDKYVTPVGNWAGIWTKESILRTLGYKFTPFEEICQKANQSQKMPTLEDFKITPAIETPSDFYNFLKKVKAGIKLESREEIIPFSMPIWLEPHLGAMFGLTGEWKYDPVTKKVSQFLGDEHSKKYFEFLNKLYTEGLLDKDFALQKDQQLQEKEEQGRVASFLYTSDILRLSAKIKALDKADSLRMIPLPKEPGTTFVGIESVDKATFQYYINKNFKNIPRLLQLFDWTLTEEYSALQNWGPKELGLWEWRAGKRIWKDKKFFDALLNNNQVILDERYYKFGLGKKSKMSIILPGMSIDLADWKRSYPFNLYSNDPTFMQALISSEGIQQNGFIKMKIDEVTGLAPTYTCAGLEQQSARLFAAKSKEEFDKNWSEIYNYYINDLKYNEAKRKMENEFIKSGFEVR